MSLYQIIETEDGLAVVETHHGASPEAVAVEHNGVLIDPGPYDSYEDAYDAMLAIADDEEDE